MKNKSLYFFIFFNAFLCIDALSQGQSKDTLYVESVSFNIMTFSSISCGNFATNFQDRIKLRIISNKDTISMLDSFLDKVVYAKKNNDVDVRAKFSFERENKSEIIICSSGYEVLVDGRLVKHNNKFTSFLKALILQK
jgi:hypothetical protein